MHLKIALVIRYVPDRHKPQEMCNGDVVENDGTLKFISDNYRNQKLHNQAVDNYVEPLEYVSQSLKLKKSVIKMLIPVLFLFILFLTNSRLKKYVIKLFP